MGRGPTGAPHPVLPPEVFLGLGWLGPHGPCLHLTPGRPPKGPGLSSSEPSGRTLQTPASSHLQPSLVSVGQSCWCVLFPVGELSVASSLSSSLLADCPEPWPLPRRQALSRRLHAQKPRPPCLVNKQQAAGRVLLLPGSVSGPAAHLSTAGLWGLPRLPLPGMLFAQRQLRQGPVCRSHRVAPLRCDAASPYPRFSWGCFTRSFCLLSCLLVWAHYLCLWSCSIFGMCIFCSLLLPPTLSPTCGGSTGPCVVRAP